MTKEEKRAQEVPQKRRRFYSRGASLIAITVLITTLFTGGIAYGTQGLIGGEAEEGVENGIWKDFKITVQQWYYDPSIIKVNPYDAINVRPGDRVRFILSSRDMTHGFAINEMGVNLAVPPGAAVIHEISIPHDMAEGTYTMYCSIFCGIGHPYLKGKIIVGAPTMFLFGIDIGKTLPYIATSVMASMFATFIIIGRRRAR